jgi:predicted amino acid dehydrogenase
MAKLVIKTLTPEQVAEVRLVVRDEVRRMREREARREERIHRAALDSLDDGYGG